jgi:hypothetical protein
METEDTLPCLHIQPLDMIQLNPILILTFYFFQINFSIILPSRSCFTRFISFRFPNRNCVCIYGRPHSCYMPCISHCPWSSSSIALGLLTCFPLELIWNYRRYRICRSPWTGDQLCCKAATYIGQHKHRRKAERHPYLEWDSNSRSQWFHALDMIGVHDLISLIIYGEKYASWSSLLGPCNRVQFFPSLGHTNRISARQDESSLDSLTYCNVTFVCFA